MAPIVGLAVALLLAGPLFAHTPGGDATPAESWWLAWSFQPLPLTGIVLASVLYMTGVRRLRRRAGGERGITRWQTSSFAIGILVLVLALLSPIDTFAGHLNWVHMIQHTMLMLVAAPLLAMSSPAVVAAWAMPMRWGRPVARSLNGLGLTRVSRYVLWHPLVLWSLFAFVLWVWHVPALYNLALRSQWVHDVQHVAFVVAAALYWRVALDPLGRVRLTPPLAVGYIFTMSLHGMLLGVLMALSPGLWYSGYAETTAAYELTPLEDQRLAGYIMWMPACGIFALIAVAILGVWLQRSVRREEAAASAVGPAVGRGRGGAERL